MSLFTEPHLAHADQGEGYPVVGGEWRSTRCRYNYLRPGPSWIGSDRNYPWVDRQKYFPSFQETSQIKKVNAALHFALQTPAILCPLAWCYGRRHDRHEIGKFFCLKTATSREWTRLLINQFNTSGQLQPSVRRDFASSFPSTCLVEFYKDLTNMSNRC